MNANQNASINNIECNAISFSQPRDITANEFCDKNQHLTILDRLGKFLKSLNQPSEEDNSWISAEWRKLKQQKVIKEKVKKEERRKAEIMLIISLY